MSGMILCRTKQAKTPFYIQEMGISIHNLEELCYYIYHNIYIIGTNLINEDLVKFIREQTNEEQLAQRLSFLLEQKAGLAEMVVTILKYVDFYNDTEIEQIREIIVTLNTQNVLERLKSRADSFLENERYNNAIANYEKIIAKEWDNSLSGIFYASVYQNLGVAYSRLFLYNRAAAYFEQAYKIGQHEQSYKCYLAARFLSSDTGIIEDDKTTEKEYVLKREIETIMDNTVYSDEYKQLADMDRLKTEGKMTQYYETMDSILLKWKKNYKKYTT